MSQIIQQIAGEITLATNPGASMKKWREIFGVTQTELADFLKITPSTISDYESNRRKSPGIRVIQRFVRALETIDKQKGGWVIKKMSPEKKEEIYEIHEFSKAIPAKVIIEKLKGRAVTNKRRLSEIKVKGYSIVDAIKAILELPVDQFAQIYGPTSNRVVVFTKVGMGRSPMVAIRVTNPKPALMIYQGLDRMDDPIAKKISEIEKIPIVLTNMDLDEIKKKLAELAK